MSNRRWYMYPIAVIAAVMAGCGPGSEGGGGTGGNGAGSGSSGSSGAGVGSGGGGGIGGDLPACNTSPVQVDSDVFDANEVYFAGTLMEATCGSAYDAIAHWRSPDVYAGDFDCDFQDGQIRPTDGRLVYLFGLIPSDFLLREFRCDICPPGGPSIADPVLPTPPCDASDPLIAFHLSPAGTTLHACNSDPATWYDSGGNVVYKAATPDEPLRFLGYGDLALTRTTVVHLPTGNSTPIVGPPGFFTARAREVGSFLLAVNMGPDHQELWEVGADGNAVKRGDYPALPAGAQGLRWDAKLEPCGALLEIDNGPDSFTDIIVRREIGGVSAVVYDEADNPAVKMHTPFFVTGP